MNKPPIPPNRSAGSTPARLALIAAVVAVIAAAFAYTAGWLSPDRVTQTKIVDNLAPPGGAALGFRRNHSKGICFTGTFDSNGAGAALSKAQVLSPGSFPVTGRFNLAVADPNTEDATSRVRGLSLRIQSPDGQEWRSAMIDAPFFPVASPQAFYDLQLAQQSKAPDAMKNFVGTHPELAVFGKWAGSAPFTGSYAEEAYNSLNSFIFTNAQGQDQAIRWSFIPAASPVAVPVDELKKRGPDFLGKDITDRVAQSPQRWSLMVTAANPGDPTADPSKAWPEDRRKIDVGALVVRKIEPEADGPCRDINFDPVVLPAGMRTSDDPFPAARSAAYSVSYNRRTAEESSYPRTASGAKQ
ncbi:catalase family peroxidase [Variovorax sp. RTB1]|uniref:catalase family peroxidase n=1 Tax=Variovorax sp. RTB1 TaxID=3048631 RepID=UPI002B22E470|nr:catalase family peroxidase [Variovorax sp. RTB1]MEB0113673.1 catalase family peroxidase [Variovorax sp. RTB1]